MEKLGKKVLFNYKKKKLDIKSIFICNQKIGQFLPLFAHW